MNYSQNNESELILKYFGERIGALLSIGENDGKTLSNVLSAIERSWSAVLIEPSETAFEKLVELHKNRENVHCYNVAISDVNGEVDFYEGGEHIGTGDTALLSTIKETELSRWKGTKHDNFVKTKVDSLTWEKFYEISPIKTFNLISIDVEGMEIPILMAMDHMELKTEMLIVEWNGKNKNIFDEIATKRGMKLYSSNNENLIYVI